MNGGRGPARGFGQALGGAARRRGEEDADLLGFEHVDQCAQARGFAGAGSAGENGHLAIERLPEARALKFVKGKTGLLFGPLDGGGNLDLRRCRTPEAGSALPPRDAG